MPKITARYDTKIKIDARPAMKLGPGEWSPIEKGQILRVVSCEPIGAKHSRITFSGKLTIGGKPWKTGVIFTGDGVSDLGHWDGLEVFQQAAAATVSSYSPAGSTRFLIPVPYQSQIGNDESLFGPDWRQCFLTSVSAAIRVIIGETAVAKAIALTGASEWEEVYAKELYATGGDTIDANAHIAALARMGIKARFRTDGNLEVLRALLRKGIPVPIGVQWRVDGHWMLAIGFDADGNIIVNDPYGERRLGAGGVADGIDDYVSIESGGECNIYSPLDMSRVWTDLGPNKGWLLKIEGEPVVVAEDSIAPQNTQKPSNLSTVTANVATVLKSLPIAASDPRQTAKAAFPAGKSIECVISNAPGDHILITLPNSDKIDGRDTWYVYRGHCTISTPGGMSDRTPGATLTLADFEAAAAEIGIETAMLQALVQVECAGSGFLPSGKPKILFEGQWFGFDSEDRWSDSHPQISKREWDRDQYFGGEAEYDRLNQAISLDKTSALGAASWGLGQVLGRNATSIGYNSVEQFVDLMYQNEFEHLRSIGRFISSNPTLLKAMQRRDFGTISLCYNGELHWKHNYAGRLEGAYQSFVG
jgi:hypothetical protein